MVPLSPPVEAIAFDLSSPPEASRTRTTPVWLDSVQGSARSGTARLPDGDLAQGVDPVGDARPDALLCWWDAVLDENLPPLSTCPWPGLEAGCATDAAAPAVLAHVCGQPLPSLAGGGADISANGNALSAAAHMSDGPPQGEPSHLMPLKRGPSRCESAEIESPQPRPFTAGRATDSSHRPSSHRSARPYEREHWLNPCFLIPPGQAALCESAGHDAAAGASQRVAAEVIAWHDECELVLQLQVRRSRAHGGERGEGAGGSRSTGGRGSRGDHDGQVVQGGSGTEAAGSAVPRAGRHDIGRAGQALEVPCEFSLPPCTCGIHSLWGAERIVEINRLNWRAAVAAVRQAVRRLGGMPLGHRVGLEGELEQSGSDSGKDADGYGPMCGGGDGIFVADAVLRQRSSSVPARGSIARAPPPRTLDLTGDPLWSILLAREGCAVSCVALPGVAAAVARRFVRASGAARREGQWAEPGVAVLPTSLMEDDIGGDEDWHDVVEGGDEMAHTGEMCAGEQDAEAIDGAALLHRAWKTLASTELECFLTPLNSDSGIDPNVRHCPRPRPRTEAVASLLLLPPSFPHLRHQWSGCHLVEMIRRRALGERLGLIRPSTPQLPCAFRLRAVLLSCERLWQRHAPVATSCGINISRFNSLGAPPRFRSLQMWQWDHTPIGHPFTLSAQALPLAPEEPPGDASHVPRYLNAEARHLPPVAASALCHAVAVWVDFNFVARTSEDLTADVSTARGTSTLGDSVVCDDGWIVTTGPVPQLTTTTRARSEQSLRDPTPWSQGIYFLEAPVSIARGERPNLTLRMALSGEGAGALVAARVGVTKDGGAACPDQAVVHTVASAPGIGVAASARQVVVDGSPNPSVGHPKRRRSFGDEEAESG